MIGGSINEEGHPVQQKIFLERTEDLLDHKSQSLTSVHSDSYRKIASPVSLSDIINEEKEEAL